MIPTAARYVLAILLLPAAAIALPKEVSDTSAAPDTGLAAVDSGLVPAGRAGESYLAGRESFRYPRTGRSDPFEFPIGRDGGEGLGPVLSELQLTGVLWAPDGPRIAILGMATGESFLLREGDRLGGAELVLIERNYVMFSISEFGRVRDFVIELKPLAEEYDGEAPEDAGNGGRQSESEPQDEQSEGNSPAEGN